MKVDYSKAFIKASKKLSGKTLDNLRRTIIEVKAAKELSDITDCKKLDGVVKFEYLVSRGQAYSKEMMQKLRSKD